MGRPSNKPERRAEIVRAMLQVMAVRGYDGASIQEIAKHAGLAPGLIHYHFKTKQDILLESVAQLSSVLRERYLLLSKDAATEEEKLKAFIDARLSKADGGDPQAVAAWVMIGAEAVRQPQVKAAYLKALKEQKALLRELLQNYYRRFHNGGKLPPKALNSKVAFVMAFMEGAFSLAVTAKEIMPDGWAAEELLSTITFNPTY